MEVDFNFPIAFSTQIAQLLYNFRLIKFYREKPCVLRRMTITITKTVRKFWILLFPEVDDIPIFLPERFEMIRNNKNNMLYLGIEFIFRC